MTTSRGWMALCVAAYVAVALWLGIGAGGFIMIDQGDYTRTVKRMVVAPIDPLDLPHSRPVSQRWTLAPFDEWKLRLYRGSATSTIALAALPARLGSGVFDTRHMAFAYSLVVAIGLLLIARRLGASSHDARSWGSGRGAPAVAVAAVAGAIFGLPLLLAAHNAALLGSFYPEIAFVIALPFVVAAMLMPASRGAHMLLFAATAMAAMSKAPFFYLPLLVAGGLWWSERHRAAAAAAPPSSNRRGAWIALAAAQLLALVVLARGEFKAMNAHHATFLGSDYGLAPAQLEAAGLPSAYHHCVGVDFWGNHVATHDATAAGPTPEGCSDLPERTMRQALGRWLRAPQDFLALGWQSLPLHSRSDYFHITTTAPYRHRVGGDAATDLLEATSQARDRLLRGLGLPIVALAMLAAALAPIGRTLRHARAPIAVLSAFAISQVAVSLLGEGVRDLGKHLAAGQYAIDMALAMLIVVGFVAATRAMRPGSAA